MVSATAADDVTYEISSVEPQSLTSAFRIDPSNGIPKTDYYIVYNFGYGQFQGA